MDEARAARDRSSTMLPPKRDSNVRLPRLRDLPELCTYEEIGLADFGAEANCAQTVRPPRRAVSR